jgi:hypothetical protein
MSLILSEDGVRWLKELQQERGGVVFYDDDKEEIYNILYMAATIKNPTKDRLSSSNSGDDTYSRISKGTYYEPKAFELEDFMEYAAGKSRHRSYLIKRAHGTIRKLYDGGYLEDL